MNRMNTEFLEKETLVGRTRGFLALLYEAVISGEQQLDGDAVHGSPPYKKGPRTL